MVIKGEAVKEQFCNEQESTEAWHVQLYAVLSINVLVNIFPSFYCVDSYVKYPSLVNSNYPACSMSAVLSICCILLYTIF